MKLIDAHLLFDPEGAQPYDPENPPITTGTLRIEMPCGCWSLSGTHIAQMDFKCETHTEEEGDG